MPEVQEAFKDVFPDGKRVLWGDFTKAYVLECAPSVLQCDQRKLLPIDVSAGEPPAGGLALGSGVWHLAPDGEHLGWTTTRNDSRPMLLGRLKREADRYVATDVKVLNPPSPKSPTDTDPRGWTNGGALYELKSFSKGGRAVTYVSSQFEGNPDMYELDLKTGERTRLTGNPDWDEDGGESPDGSLLSMYSDRGMHRVDTAGLLPRRSFIDYPISLNAAIYYVGTTPGFQCDLQPWLMPASGDDEGARLGQPLTVYDGGDVHAQNNVPGRGAWSPDSTKVALTEMSYTSGMGGERLRVARLDREAGAPLPVVSSEVGSWATTPELYRGTNDVQGTVTVKGLHSGTATITHLGNLFAGSHSVVYHDYSDDGKSFVSGTESIDAPAFTMALAHNKADLTIRGEHNGFLKADFSIGRQLGTPQANGRVTSELDGYRMSGGIQQLGGCPQTLPRRQPLAISARVANEDGGRVAKIAVTADSGPTLRAGDHFGDRRPVARATVTLGDQSARTDELGIARIAVPAAIDGSATVTASAGDTFSSVSKDVDVPALPKASVPPAASGPSGPEKQTPVRLTVRIPRQRLATVLRRGTIEVRCRADVAGQCAARVAGGRALARRLHLAVPRGADLRVLGRGSATLPTAGERTVRVRLTAAARRALQKHAGRSTRLSVRVAASAPGRLPADVTRPVTIRR